MNKPKNLIIEKLADTTLKSSLYKLMEKDVPLYYSNNADSIPSSTNLIKTEKLAIFIAPTKEQRDYVDKRILDLYDDISPDLKDFTESLLTQDKPIEEVLVKILTQYDTKEVSDYLVAALEQGSLHNFASTQLVDKFVDEENYRAAEIHACYYKGELEAYSLSVINEEFGFCMFYNDSLKYPDALKWFYNSVKEQDKYLLKGLMDKQQQM